MIRLLIIWLVIGIMLAGAFWADYEAFLMDGKSWFFEDKHNKEDK